MPELPADAAAEAQRLTRLARDATDPAAADAYRDRRDELLADHGFLARVRDADATLVCYPTDWLTDGTVHPGDIDDPDRAVERSLAGGGEQGDYEHAAARNAAIVDRVAAAHDDVHAQNAAAFAAFMNNHYARPMDTATDAERTRFREEFFPRNAWPSADQRDAIEASLAIIDDIAATTDEDTA
ncbi:rnhA operon protein [Halobacterium salinarum]|nr:rnhA operon protein [Halobacterium salinarum]MDL0129431.1 rnhA operon protein [Halobacterium salinarum]MDL0140175.1 rnhA operon protein [Halobacterium salinarum]